MHSLWHKGMIDYSSQIQDLKKGSQDFYLQDLNTCLPGTEILYL